uniref:Uncharacterized protein n=1 Tax=Nelumbo nucifera TaxID=4432 RepID=A0A822Y2I1_NELNU|nr:TPA_asm: hypothetical protein HUJ06_026930 [Nelumbo nucifera]
MTNLVGDDVELLLVFILDVDGALKSMRLVMLDLCKSEAICLHANEMLDRTITSSESMFPTISSFNSQVFRVLISYPVLIVVPVVLIVEHRTSTKMPPGVVLTLVVVW